MASSSSSSCFYYPSWVLDGSAAHMRCYSILYKPFHYARSGGVSGLRSHAPYREAVSAPAYHSTMGVMRPLSYSTCYRYRACQGLLSALRLGTVEVSSWHVAVYGTGFLRQVRSSYKLCSTDHSVFEMYTYSRHRLHRGHWPPGGYMSYKAAQLPLRGVFSILWRKLTKSCNISPVRCRFF